MYDMTVLTQVKSDWPSCGHFFFKEPSYAWLQATLSQFSVYFQVVYGSCRIMTFYVKRTGRMSMCYNRFKLQRAHIVA